jgi:hypothetical protein
MDLRRDSWLVSLLRRAVCYVFIIIIINIILTNLLQLALCECGDSTLISVPVRW